MLKYIQAGGWSMFLVLAFGLILLVTAVRFFLKATPERLAFLRAMTLAQVFCVVGGVAGNVTVVLWSVGATDEAAPLPWRPLLIGLGEALTPAGAGLPLLAVTWLLVAIGVRRAHDLTV